LAAFHSTGSSHSSYIAFSDETEAVDWMMAVKSDEELNIIRSTANVQDHLFATAVKNAKPCITDAALTALGRAEATRNGGAGGIILGGSGPQGSFASFRPITRQSRMIKEGDFLPLLIEVSGPGGYFTEVARTLSFGKGGPALAEANAAVTEMQHSIIKAFKPGTLCADILAEHNRDRTARKTAAGDPDIRPRPRLQFGRAAADPRRRNPKGCR
jgi:Xaa-Pro aminopeptidase